MSLGIVHASMDRTDSAPEERLAQAVAALLDWQRRQDRMGANRHGRCLEATRAALASAGLFLPPPQPRPRNLALSNYEILRQNPARWGWMPAPADARYTLDYFDHVGRLPDGRIAGHIAIADHQEQILRSSWDYPLDSYWRSMRIGSFVPRANLAGSKEAKAAAPHPVPADKAASPYLDAEARDAAAGTLLRRIPSCVLLASDGHAYLRAAAIAEVLDEPCAVNDTHRDGVLILRCGKLAAGK